MAWLPGYSHRVEIPISGSMGSADPYQMVDFKCYKGTGSNGAGYMYCNNHIDDDFDGIRFTKESNGTTLLSKYPHDLSAGTSCEFDVAVPAGETSIYCYYDTGKSAQKYPLKHGLWVTATSSQSYKEQAVRYSGTYDRTYIAYQAVDSSAWLVAYDHTNSVWLTPKKIGDALRADNHGVPGFDIVPSGAYAGYGHFFYGAHGANDMVYYRADLDMAWDSISFTDKSAATNDAYSTYPRVHVDDDGRIWWFYRGRHIVTNHAQYASYQYSDDNGDNWTSVNDFMYMVGGICYISGIAFESGSTPKIHIAWDNNTANIYYAYRNPGDGAQKWYDIADTDLGTQITLDEESTKVFTGYNRHVDLELDSNNYPWLMFIEGAGEDDIYFYGWNGSSWDTATVLSGTAVDGTSTGEMLRTSDTQVEAYITELVDGVGEVRHYRGTYSAGSWSFALQTAITSGSDEGLLNHGNGWVKIVKHANTSDVLIIWTYSPVGTPAILRSYPIDIESADFDTVNPTNIFIDRFNRTYLSTYYVAARRFGIWRDRHEGDGQTPDISSNKLRIRITAIDGTDTAMAEPQSDYDFVEGVRFRTSVEKSSWGASVKSIVGLVELGNGWLNQAAGEPNDGIRLTYTNTTTLYLGIYIGGVKKYESSQTIGSGTNEIEVKYDFTTGSFSVLIDGVEKWSGDKSDTGDLCLSSPLSPFASGYNNIQETLYDYMTMGEYVDPAPSWDTTGAKEAAGKAGSSMAAKLVAAGAI